MIQRIAINPNQIKSYTEVRMTGSPELEGFPLLSIDTDSYIVSAEIQSGINFDISSGRHCLAIGKGCSLADGITFMMDLNHDYLSVSQGALSFLKDVETARRIHRKGSIIIQNDVWIGHGATIMSGVVLHNGCVVATDAVVTKDVPPYAMVGGNPARIIKYRFDEATIAGLQKIAWWNWPENLKAARKKDFSLPPSEFVNKYLPECERRIKGSVALPRDTDRKIILFYPDVQERFPLYPKILGQFLERDRPDCELLLYLPRAMSSAENIRSIERELEKYDSDCYVTFQTGEDIPDHTLFRYSDYYITTRSERTVYHTDLCDLHAVKILFGTDDPIFGNLSLELHASE